MTFFTTYFAVFVVFAVSTISVESVYPILNGFKPIRDEWYKIPKRFRFDELPRIFDPRSDCPAKSFFLDCNRCFCEKDGKHARCTLIGCPEVPQIVHWAPGKPCPAGRPFYWKCNNCECFSNGRQAACTRKACPDLSVHA